MIQVYLLPGTLHCARQPSEVSTVLGSCVAVCLSDRASGISGMNHFVLPSSHVGHSDLRYGDVAIDDLVETMCRTGSRIDTLEAKIFGGSDVLAMLSHQVTVGARNILAAEARLRHHGIPIVARRTGGQHGVYIRLLSVSGDVLVRALSPVNLPTLH